MDALKPAPVVADPLTGERRYLTDVEARSFAQVRAALDRGDEIDARKRRTAQEMARAFAIQQPQGLGLLFPGLRPKGQR